MPSDPRSKTLARLQKIAAYYCSQDDEPIWKLKSRRDEAFLAKTLKESDPSSKEFAESAFFLGKYYHKKNRKTFQDALKRAARTGEWSAAYGVMISLEDIGETPLDSLRKRGINSFGILNENDNRDAALAYLRKIYE